MSKTVPSQTASIPDSNPLRLGDFLPFRLSVLSNTISSAIAVTYENRFGLNIWQWRCMAVLGETPGLTGRELTARTAMDKVAVSRAVSGLEAMGHVHRKADTADRRASRLSLTPSGQRIYREIVPLAQAYEARLLEDFSPEDLRALHELMEKLAKASAPDDTPLW
ncbi:MAG: MarR family winged helix-turn-helix transcriptional regulator [Pseudomonadota bacterium]